MMLKQKLINLPELRTMARSDQHFCLRWMNYQSNMTSVFHHLLQNEAFVDVTLACNDGSFKAHKVVLSACSSYFEKLLMDNPCDHPTIILPQEVSFHDLKFIVDFVYRGEIDISEGELQSLLRTADQLKIKGLYEPDMDGEKCDFDADERRKLRFNERIAANESVGKVDAMSEKDSYDSEDGAAISARNCVMNSMGDNAWETDGNNKYSPISAGSEGNNDGGRLPLAQTGPDSPRCLRSPIGSCVGISSEEMTDRGKTYDTFRPLDESDHRIAHHADYCDSEQTMMITPEFVMDSTNDSEGDNSKYSKCWRSEDMDLALNALRNREMSLTKASAVFGIPSTTLWQRAHRLGIDTPKKDNTASKHWDGMALTIALDAMRSGAISANKASKAYGIPSSTLYKIARKEGIRLAAPFNATPTTWRREDLDRALESIRRGDCTVQKAAVQYGIPSGTLYGRCKRKKIELSRNNPSTWSEDAMMEALDAVRSGQMSINQAAIHFNLPYSSLYGRIKRGKYGGEDHIGEDRLPNETRGNQMRQSQPLHSPDQRMSQYQQPTQNSLHSYHNGNS